MEPPIADADAVVDKSAEPEMTVDERRRFRPRPETSDDVESTVDVKAPWEQNCQLFVVSYPAMD